MKFASKTPNRSWVLPFFLAAAVLLSCVHAGAAAQNAPAETVAPEKSARDAAFGGSNGIYSLQASVRFDDLQAVVYDPQDHSLTLLGDRRSEHRLLPIPYLDHLATALESDSPAFTLPWAEGTQRAIDVLSRDARGSNTALWDRIVKNARAQLFSPQNRLTEEGLRILQTLNFPTDGYEPYLTNKYDVMAESFSICGADQQATIVGAYARSLRDPDELNTAIRELAMARALDASMIGPGSADLWEIFLERFAGVFDVDDRMPVSVFRRRRQQGNHLVIARNAAVENILATIDPLWAGIFPNSLELSAATKSHIHLPPDLVQSLAEINFAVKPTWRGIEPESRLAQVMFDADMLGKWIASDPSLLGTNAPFHKTEYEWFHKMGPTTPQTTTNNIRYWISPDVVELAESDDGNVLEFRKFTMRVNTNDPASESYTNYLTSIYDQLANELPTLHELAESAKIMAVAQWLKKKDPDFKLPKEGRSRWDPPDWTWGFIAINAVVRVSRTDTASETRVTGKWTSVASLEGGVSLRLEQAVRMDGNVLFDGARGPRNTLGRVTLVPHDFAGAVTLDETRKLIVPEIYDNQTLRNVLRQKTTPPPPMPPGATGKATLGKRKLEYLSVLRDRLGDKADARAVQIVYQDAVRIAKKIEFNDKMINDLQTGRIQSMEALEQARRWAKAERVSFWIDMFDMLSGGLSTMLQESKLFRHRTNMAELLDAEHRSAKHWMLLMNRYGPKVKSLLADIETAKESIRSGDDFDRHLGVVNRSVDLMKEINKAIGDIPTDRFKYVPFATSVVSDTLKTSEKLIELGNRLRDVDMRSEQLGSQATYAKRLQEREAAYFEMLQVRIDILEAVENL